MVRAWSSARGFALILALLFAAPVASAQTGGGREYCRLSLILALDVSSSVDAREYRLQRDGLAAALESPDVLSAILDGDGTVALAIYEWSGRQQSSLVVDWIALTSPLDVSAVANRLRASQRSHHRFPTAMGFALGFGATLMRDAPQCDRKVIDVSGDGVTNDGYRPRLAYKHFPFSDITVNGLAVLGADADVVGYFESEVKFGPGAFVETAEGYAGFRRAMERKLLREIASQVIGAVAPASSDANGRRPG